MANNRLRVHLPNIDKGVEVQVLHLGLFANGTTHNIDDDKVQIWQEATGRSWPDDSLLDVSKPFQSLATDPGPVTVAQDEPVTNVPVEPDNKGAAK